MFHEPVKQETKDEYLKIWVHFAVGHQSRQQLAEMLGCSEDKVSNAIKWCAENRVQFDVPVLVEAAKEALETRLRELNSDLKSIKSQKNINWNAVIGMNKLIKENEELLWKLQSVIQDRSMIITINAMQVNQVLKVRDEVAEKLNDDERRNLATRIREVINK